MDDLMTARLIDAVNFLLDYARRVAQGQVRQGDLMELVHIRQLVKEADATLTKGESHEN